jgi:DNA replication protein DnaC
MGYLNLEPEQTNIFLKLIKAPYRRRGTIIMTNVEYDEWHNFLGNKPLVTALLSRLLHQCHTVGIDGPSLREPQGSANATPATESPRPKSKRTEKPSGSDGAPDGTT